VGARRFTTTPGRMERLHLLAGMITFFIDVKKE
jgi:hypothetical protein